MSECIIGTYISANRKGWGIIPYILFSSAKTDENIWFFFWTYKYQQCVKYGPELPPYNLKYYLHWFRNYFTTTSYYLIFYSWFLREAHEYNKRIKYYFFKFDDCTPKTFDKVDTGDGRDTGALYLYSPLLSLVKD